MNKTIVLAFLLFTNVIAFAQNFKIEGTVEGIENGSWLYLRLSSPQDLIDSTQVALSKFSCLFAVQLICTMPTFTLLIFLDLSIGI